VVPYPARPREHAGALGSHRNERSSGKPDQDEQRPGTYPRSRTVLNGPGCPTWNYGLERHGTGSSRLYLCWPIEKVHRSCWPRHVSQSVSAVSASENGQNPVACSRRDYALWARDLHSHYLRDTPRLNQSRPGLTRTALRPRVRSATPDLRRTSMRWTIPGHRGQPGPR
jgi:hypothetical protein